MSVQSPQALFPQSTPTQKPPSSPQSDAKFGEFLDSAPEATYYRPPI